MLGTGYKHAIKCRSAGCRRSFQLVFYADCCISSTDGLLRIPNLDSAQRAPVDCIPLLFCLFPFCPSFLHPFFVFAALSVSFHLSLSLGSFGVPSAYSKSRANKQAAGGSRLLSIIQASQTTARMFARHIKCISQHHSERKKEYVLPSWLGLNTQGISHHPARRLKSCL